MTITRSFTGIAAALIVVLALGLALLTSNVGAEEQEVGTGVTVSQGTGEGVSRVAFIGDLEAVHALDTLGSGTTATTYTILGPGDTGYVADDYDSDPNAGTNTDDNNFHVAPYLGDLPPIPDLVPHRDEWAKDVWKYIIVDHRRLVKDDSLLAADVDGLRVIKCTADAGPPVTYFADPDGLDLCSPSGSTSHDVSNLQVKINWWMPTPGDNSPPVDRNDPDPTPKPTTVVPVDFSDPSISRDVFFDATALNTATATSGGATNCNNLFNWNSTDGFVETGVGHGLMTTGQLGFDGEATARLEALRQACIQGEITIYHLPWMASKHLPPGWYHQSAKVVHTGGSNTGFWGTHIFVEPTLAFMKDFTSLDFGTIDAGDSEQIGGDFVWDYPHGVANGVELKPTVMGLGNTSPELNIVASHLVDASGGNLIPALNSVGWRELDWDFRINRRDSSGNIVHDNYQIQRVGFSGLVPTDTGTIQISRNALNEPNPNPVAPENICLEPNEHLKLDISLRLPPNVPQTGLAYTGTVLLTAVATDVICVPSLDPGENHDGDADVDDNNWSQGNLDDKDVPTTT